MNIDDINSDSELLNLFLDDELDSNLHADLLDKLAVDTELQAEQQELLTIRKAIQDDDEAYTPPAVAAAIIFERVGLRPVATLAPAATALWTRWVAPIGVAFLAGVLGFVWSGNNNNIDNDLANFYDPASGNSSMVATPSQEIVQDDAATEIKSSNHKPASKKPKYAVSKSSAIAEKTDAIQNNDLILANEVTPETSQSNIILPIHNSNYKFDELDQHGLIGNKNVSQRLFSPYTINESRPTDFEIFVGANGSNLFHAGTFIDFRSFQLGLMAYYGEALFVNGIDNRLDDPTTFGASLMAKTSLPFVVSKLEITNNFYIAPSLLAALSFGNTGLSTQLGIGSEIEIGRLRIGGYYQFGQYLNQTSADLALPLNGGLIMIGWKF